MTVGTYVYHTFQRSSARPTRKVFAAPSNPEKAAAKRRNPRSVADEAKICEYKAARAAGNGAYEVFKSSAGAKLNTELVQKKAFLKYLKGAAKEKAGAINEKRSEITQLDQDIRNFAQLNFGEETSDEVWQRKQPLLLKYKAARESYAGACTAFKECKAKIEDAQQLVVSLKGLLIDQFNEWILCPENAIDDEPTEVYICPSVGKRRCHTALMPIIAHRNCVERERVGLANRFQAEESDRGGVAAAAAGGGGRGEEGGARAGAVAVIGSPSVPLIKSAAKTKQCRRQMEQEGGRVGSSTVSGVSRPMWWSRIENGLVQEKDQGVDLRVGDFFRPTATH
jgi:hypothetical protein